MKNPTDLIASCQSSSVGRFTLFLCCVYFIGLSGLVGAQDFGREWIRYQNRLEDPNLSLLKNVVTDASGNVYVMGETESSTEAINYLTIKYSPAGTKLWQREYNTPLGNGDDIAHDLAVDDAGNVYVTGSSAGVGTSPHNILTVKYDSFGNEIWARRFGGCRSEGLFIGINKTNGDVIVAAFAECSNYLIVCYNAEGGFRWQQGYEVSTDIDRITDFHIDATGHTYVTGLKGDDEEFVTIRTMIRTMKFDAEGVRVWTKDLMPPVVAGPEPESADMAVDEVGNVFLLVQNSRSYMVMKHTIFHESRVILVFPEVRVHEGYGPSSDIEVLGNDLYISINVHSAQATKKYNIITSELLWERENTFYPGDSYPDNPVRMQIDGSGNVYLGGRNWGGTGSSTNSYKIISYSPGGAERWSLYEFPSGGSYSFENFHVSDEDKVHVVATRHNASPTRYYVVAKYAILPPPPEDVRPDPVIPRLLRDYQRFAFGAYAPGRDWCWTGIDIDWTIICEQVPSMCPDFPVSTLTENGKIIWQQEFTKPANFLLPVDDKLPRQLSLSIPMDGSSQDVIVLDQNLVNRGISLFYVVTNGDKNWLDLKAETIQGESVPFTMTLLNKEGQEIWQETFVAPLEKQIEAYVHEPGVTLQFSALPEELQLSYFPNPFSETITVSLEASKKSPAQISVLSLQGEKIIQEQVDVTGDHPINMKNQKPGFYILVLNVKGDEVRKLIELKK